jgi:hypothetical protein
MATVASFRSIRFFFTDSCFSRLATVSSPAFVGRDAPKVNMMDPMADFSASSVAASSNMIASNTNDFGGLLFPVFGLLFLGAIILYLAPPFADE